MTTAISRSPRQAKCGVCGKLARPGSAIVIHEGAGGRVHKQCAQKSAVSLTAIHCKSLTEKDENRSARPDNAADC